MKFKLKIKKSQVVVWLFFALVVGLLALTALKFGWLWAGAALLAIGGAIVLQGLRHISNDPPHIAVLTIFGERVKRIVKEGWGFFPLYPFWHGFVLIKVVKINFDLPLQQVTTPDLAKSEVSLHITIIPAGEFKPADGRSLEEVAELMIAYLNSGGPEGVQRIVGDRAKERLRSWAISDKEGPQDFKELRGANDMASAVLLKFIVGDEIGSVGSDIPTSAIWDFLFNKKPLIADYKQIWEGYNDDEKKRVREAVEERRKCARAVSQGSGKFLLRDLGAFLVRLNIGQIKPLGEAAAAEEKRVKEALEQVAERTERQHVDDELQEIMRRHKSDGCTFPDAVRLFQSERNKAPMTVAEHRVTLGADIVPALVQVVKPIMEALAAKAGAGTSSATAPVAAPVVASGAAPKAPAPVIPPTTDPKGSSGWSNS